MSVFHLNLKPSSEELSTYFGGLPHLASETSWPLCPSTKRPQLHLLTLGPEFFFTPTIAEGHSVSVFVSFDYEQPSTNLTLPREFAVNQATQAANTTHGFCQVLLHKNSSTPTVAPFDGYLALPKCIIEKSPFSSEELKEEVATPGQGLDVSKFGGIPGWLQDDISLGPKLGYLLQINEYDIRIISPLHEGIFREGIGYLYLNRNAKKLISPCEVGHFFIQFT